MAKRFSGFSEEEALATFQQREDMQMYEKLALDLIKEEDVKVEEEVLQEINVFQCKSDHQAVEAYHFVGEF